jgi:hypothetical protein
MPEQENDSSSSEVTSDDIKKWFEGEVALEVQSILEEGADYYPKHSTPENGALLCWIANHFIDANPNDLLFADGPDDAQIDIFHDTTTDETATFRIIQVSAPSLAEIGAGRRGKDIGDKLVGDARGLYNAIIGTKVKRARYNETALQARGLINSAIQNVTDNGPKVVIVVQPITLKRLPLEKAKQYEELQTESQTQWSAATPGVTWVLRPPLTAEALFPIYEARKRPAELPQKLTLHVPHGVAYEKTKGPILAFVSGRDILEAYGKYRSMLFDANLRFELGKSTSVNEKIANEVKTAKGIARFHEKNNGIVIACFNCGVRGEKTPAGKMNVETVELTKPQVINGAQTISTLYRVYSELNAISVPAREAKDVELLDALTHSLVLPAKIVIVDDSSYKRVDDIAIASNTQNPLSQRTLRSSSNEMRRLKRILAAADRPWFAETKDGEWEAIRDLKPLLQSVTKGKTHRDFQYGPKKAEVRKLDNKTLGIALLCLHGYVEAAKASTLFDRMFLRAFNSHVLDDKWQELAAIPCRASTLKDDALPDFFDASPAGPHQYLLAYFLFEYFQEWTFAETTQFVMAYEEAAQKDPEFLQYQEKDKRWNVPEVVNAELLKDDDSCYWTERVARAAYKVLVHQAMRVLVQRYGNLTEETCLGILHLPEFQDLLEGHPARKAGDFRTARLDRGPLTSVARVLHLACRNMFNAHSAEIRAILSPQQVLLQQKWTQRLGDQVDQICKRIGNVSYRTGTKLDPDGDVTAAGLQQLLPPLAREKA